MPYTPMTLTSRAHFDGSLNWETIPPFATFPVSFGFQPLDSEAIPDPVSRRLMNQMIDPRLGSWSGGGFTSARAGRYRFAAQFLVLKEHELGERLEAFLRLEVIRQDVRTVLAVCDVVHHLAEDAEIVLPLAVEATPVLEPGDRVQVRFGLIQDEWLSITTEPVHSFCDVTAYWS